MRTSAVAVIVVAASLMLVSVCFGQAKCPPGPEVKIWGGLDSKPHTSDSYGAETAAIGIGSFELFELPGGAAGYTLAEREVAVYNRLTEILSHGPIRADQVCVGRVRSAPTVYVRNFRLVSVYASDAAATGSTQQALAEAWRDRVAEVLPKITAPTGGTQWAPGAPGEVYDVAIGGILLFRLRDRNGCPSLAYRGREVEDSVVRMLSDGRKGRLRAEAVPVGKEWAVQYGDVQVVTATAGDAMGSGNKSTQALAMRWAATLNTALDKLKEDTGSCP